MPMAGEIKSVHSQFTAAHWSDVENVTGTRTEYSVHFCGIGLSHVCRQESLDGPGKSSAVNSLGTASAESS